MGRRVGSVAGKRGAADLAAKLAVGGHGRDGPRWWVPKSSSSTMTAAGLEIPQDALAALSSPSRVALVHAPPGLGAESVVLAWQATLPGMHQRVDLTTVTPEAFGRLLSSMEGVSADGTIVATGGQRLTRADLAALAPAAGWRVVIVDEASVEIDPAPDTAVIEGHRLVYSEDELARIIGDLPGATDPGLTAAFWNATHGWPELVLLGMNHARRFGSGVDSTAIAYAIRERVQARTLPWLLRHDVTVRDYVAATGMVVQSELGFPASVLRCGVERLLDAGVLQLAGLEGDRVLRVLPAIGEGLAEELKADSARERAALRAVVQTRSTRGLLDCGLGAAVALRDWELSLSICESWWLRLLGPEYRDVLFEALVRMPAAMLRSSAVASNVAELIGILPEGLPLRIPKDPEALRTLAVGEGAREFMNHATVRVVAKRVSGRLREAHHAALSATAVVDLRAGVPAVDEQGAELGQRAAVSRSFWCAQVGLACELVDDPHSAARFFRQGWQQHEWDRLAMASRDIAFKLATHHAVAGDGPEAQRWLNLGRGCETVTNYWNRFLERSAAMCDYILALDAGDLDAAAKYRDGYDDYLPTHEQWHVSMWAQVREAMMRGTPHRALGLIDSMADHHPRALADESGLHARVVRMLRAELALALGRGNQAETLIRQGIATNTFGGVTDARFEYLTGNVEAAAAVASALMRNPRAGVRVHSDAALIQAAAELAVGHERAAKEIALRAAALIDTSGYRSALRGLARHTVADLAALDPRAKALITWRDEQDGDDLYPVRVDHIRLTQRELSVLEVLCTGLPLSAVASRLFVSRNTIKTQLRGIYAKLGVTSREEAITRARVLALIEA